VWAALENRVSGFEIMMRHSSPLGDPINNKGQNRLLRQNTKRVSISISSGQPVVARRLRYRAICCCGFFLATHIRKQLDHEFDFERKSPKKQKRNVK